MPTFSSLKYRDYAYLWSSTCFNSLAQWMQQVAVGWLVWEMSQSPLMVGLSTGIRFLPFLISAPVSGVLVDRIDRRQVVMFTQTFLTVLALVFAVMVATETVRIWHTFVFMFLIGMGWSIDRVARQAMVASSVPRSAYSNAFAVHSMAINLTRTIGPAVGGILIDATGTATNFFILAGLYVMVAVMVLPVRTSGRAAPSKQRQAASRDFTDGLRYVRTDSLLLTVLLMGFASALFIQPVTQVMPVVADEVLGGGAALLGILQSSFAVGGILATFGIASFRRMQRRSTWLMGSLVPQAVALLIFSQVPTVWIAVPVLAGLGFFQMAFNVNNTTQTQMLAPDEMRGRVLSLQSANNGIQPLGAAIVGGIAEFTGIGSAIFIAGAAAALAALWLGARYGRVSKEQAERLASV